MLHALPFATFGESAAAAVQTLRRAQADAVTRIDAPLSAARSVCSERSWCYLCHAAWSAQSKDAWRFCNGAFVNSKREGSMLFICFLNWTDQGAKGVKGVAARHESLKAEIAGLGGRLIGGYVTRGQYDVVLVLEMPDGDAMTKLSVAMTSRGHVRTTTVRAYLPEEFGKLAAEVP